MEELITKKKVEIFSKKELIETIAELTETSVKDIKLILDAFVTTITSEMNKNKKVALSGFGTFIAKIRPERQGRNISTGESVIYPAKKVAKFTAAKKLKDTLEQNGL